MRSPVDFNDSEINKARITPRTTTIYLHITTTIFFSILALLILAGIFEPPSFYCNRSTPPNPQSSPLASRPYTCGNTTLSAIAQNCTFDPIYFSWLPAPCTDAPLTAAFLAQRNWTWYFDRNGIGKQLAPREEVLQGEHDNLYVSAEYHILHCTYMWRKMHRAVSTGKLIDGYIGNLHHTSHCEKMIVEAMEVDEEGKGGVVNTVIRMKWPDCPVVW